MASVDPEDEELMRFVFDKDGVVTIPDALTERQLADINALLDERIESDIPAADSDWRTMRFPVTSAGSQTVAGRTDILFLHHEESLLEWGLEMRSVLDNSRVSPLLAAICGEQFRLDHLYIDIIKPPLEGAEEQLGPIQAGLHGASGAFSPEIYYHFDRGEMHNGLVSVAYNLRPVGPMDGGTAVVPGTHKSNYQFPSRLADMADPKVGVHEIVRRCGGPAGSACVFTESCTHGTIPWRGAGERRTLFMKFSPRSVSWSDIYFDADRLPWAAELSDRERQILMAPAAPFARASAAASAGDGGAALDAYQAVRAARLGPDGKPRL